MRTRVAIIGAGFSGLGLASRLKLEGENDFVVLERAERIGGTWRDNTYPGCGCDVPSHLYSYSWSLNPHWARSFARQEEIQRYLERCAGSAGLSPHVLCGHEVQQASWLEDQRVWKIETSRTTVIADVLVSATGVQSEPFVPPLAGLEAFEGELLHSARWNHDFDPRGRRVAVIGTGASAIQIVPEIQPQADKLYVFQRTPPWILPRFDRRLTRLERWLHRRVPVTMRLRRAAIYWGRELLVGAFTGGRLNHVAETLARLHLRWSVRDREMRADLTPSYRIGCKRVVLSSDYLPALGEPNVELVTGPVTELRARSIVGGGTEREVDAVVLATGFRATDPPIAYAIRGAGGRTLADAWQGSPKAYLGVTVAGFPNLFLLAGPNTGTGHTSAIFMAEQAIDYTLKAMNALASRDDVAAIAPRQEAQDRYVAELDRRSASTVWVSGGCASYYLDATGRNSVLWPRRSVSYRRRLARLDLDDYEVMPPARGAAARRADAAIAAAAP